MIREKTDVVVVWTTWPGDDDPASFARALIRERLAACVTAQPGLRSLYRWQGDIEDATEYQLTIKTTKDRVDELRRRCDELHPYDVPEFLVLSVAAGSAAYLGWVSESTTGSVDGG